MTTRNPIPAFCSSDEEDEDGRALLYLPIAPEIEEPEVKKRRLEFSQFLI